MDFTIKSNNKKEVSISVTTANKIIELLDKVDCTAVWSEHDNQYIKIHDVPDHIIDELIVKLKLIK